jgi:hypothetical protein
MMLCRMARCTVLRPNPVQIRCKGSESGADPVQDLPLFLSGDEVARLLGVDPSTIANTRARGEPPGGLGVRIGKRVRYPTGAVVAYLEGLGIDPAETARAIANLSADLP